MKRLLCVLLWWMGVSGWGLGAGVRVPLIPAPCEVVYGEGEVVLPRECGVAVDEGIEAGRLLGVLAEAGVAVRRVGGGEAGWVRVRRGEVRNPHGFAGAYRLEASGDGVVVAAADREGFIHAAETLRQFIAGGKMPQVVVEDWPAFPIRGFMLDTGRNYQTPALIKEQIEVMARYKLNVFHFHLTDNPGWRLESKVHPRVTDPASMTRSPGRYYSHAEFRDLVAFCRERGITLIPELDVPGHTAALRKAMGIQSMNLPESRRLVKDLLSELASLAPAEVMPYIHIGTDEVREPAERVDATYLPEMSAHVRGLGREVIGWRQGLHDPADTRRITQLWARAEPLPGNPFIDCRSTYINHMDPFECVSTFLFQQPCRRVHGDRRALGGVLCSWPDIRIANERDQLLQNPVYPAMLTYAESLWRGVPRDDREAYWANLPPPGSPEFARFAEFEERLLAHKERWFRGKEFTYVKQGDLRWRIIGPFPHGGDVAKAFPVEDGLRAEYQVDGRGYRWRDESFAGATVYLRHFFGFGSPVKEAEGTCYALTHVWSPRAQDMPAWIGFHTSSRSDRRGATVFEQGEWHPKKPWIRINGVKVPPPVWQNAAPMVKNDETPFTNEDYYCRPPSVVRLRAGWNEVLVKIPHRKADWKWMFTFVPVGDTRELRYSDALPPAAPEQ